MNRVYSDCAFEQDYSTITIIIVIIITIIIIMINDWCK